MSADIRERAAELLLGLIPFYHRHIMKTGCGITGMQAAQYRMLGVLTKEGTLPMSEIGRRLYISKPYMTALADMLIGEGLVERRSDPDDRRVINITITQKGKTHLKQSGTLFKNDLKLILTGLDEKDLEMLCCALENLQGILAKIP
jgi:DNA-binding MarR family transcriptional regulator